MSNAHTHHRHETGYPYVSSAGRQAAALLSAATQRAAQGHCSVLCRASEPVLRAPSCAAHAAPHCSRLLGGLGCHAHAAPRLPPMPAQMGYKVRDFPWGSDSLFGTK